MHVYRRGQRAYPALHPEIPLADMQRLTCMLLECGATIHEINTLRKHLSRFSGGSLVRAAFPATVLALDRIRAW